METVRDAGWDCRCHTLAPRDHGLSKTRQNISARLLPRRLSREVAAHFSKQVVSNKKSSLKPSHISNHTFTHSKVRASEMSTVAGGEGSVRHHNYCLHVSRKKEAEINTETNCTISRGLLSRLEWNMQKQQLNVLAYTLFSMISGHLWR